MENIDKSKSAFDQAGSAIVKALGRGASRDQLTEVVLMLAHSCLTENESLDLAAASHNSNVFCDQLKQLVTETQKNKLNSPVGRVM